MILEPLQAKCYIAKQENKEFIIKTRLEKIMKNITAEITVYGADWCPDCRRAKRILEETKTVYRWVDIDKDREGEQFVIRTNHGNRSIPTIVFHDGGILVEPSNEQLSAKLSQIPSRSLD